MTKRLPFRLALALVVGWVMTGNIARADYAATLNTIAGADKISYWGLNETSGFAAADSWTTDLIDGSNMGTYSGIGATGVTVGAAGPRPDDGFHGFPASNNAVNFGGTDTTQLLKMAHSDGYNSLKSLTMLMWINIPNATTGQFYYGGITDGTVAGPPPPGGRYGFGIVSNLKPRPYVRLQNGPTPTDSDEINNNAPTDGTSSVSSHFRDGNWHLVALTLADNQSTNNKEYKLYVDGNLEFGGGTGGNAGVLAGGYDKHLGDRHTKTTDGLLGSIIFGGDPGATADANRRAFKGRMDEIAFISRALTLEDVGQLWSAATTLPVADGDFNDDGFVDAADYVVWRKTMGDPERYDLWRTTFGISPGGGAALANQPAAIPEPTAIGTAFLLVFGALGSRPRRFRPAA